MKKLFNKNLIHIIAWFIFILFTILINCYPKHIGVYVDEIDRAFAQTECLFIWMGFVGVWFGIYMFFVYLYELKN